MKGKKEKVCVLGVGGAGWNVRNRNGPVDVATSVSLPGPKMTDTSITFQPRLIDWVGLYKLKNTGHLPFLIDCK